MVTDTQKEGKEARQEEGRSSWSTNLAKFGAGPWHLNRSLSERNEQVRDVFQDLPPPVDFLLFHISVTFDG